MNVDRLLDVLVRSGALVGRTRDGHVAALGLPAELASTVAALDVELALAVAGRGSGHRWARCPTCGAPQLIATGQGHGCQQTVKCKGHLKVLTKPKDPDPLAEGLDCARPGCDKPAHYLTAGHEPICHLDLLHLAIYHQENPPT